MMSGGNFKYNYILRGESLKKNSEYVLALETRHIVSENAAAAPNGHLVLQEIIDFLGKR